MSDKKDEKKEKEKEKKNLQDNVDWVESAIDRKDDAYKLKDTDETKAVKPKKDDDKKKKK